MPEQGEGGGGGAAEEVGEPLVRHGDGPYGFEGGHGRRPGPARQRGGLSDDVAGTAQGEQGLVTVGGRRGHLGPAVHDEQDVRRGLVLVQEFDAGREAQFPAESEEDRAVRALRAGQEGDAVVETSVTR